MNVNLYTGQEYILKFFPREMLAPTTTAGYRATDELRALLTNDTPDLRLIRNQLNGCLELAYRKGIVGVELTSRMQSSDYESFESAFAELKVARFIESLGNAIKFYPPGRKKRSLEFRAMGTQSSCLVEVKTLFSSKDERTENGVSDKLWYYARKTNLPFLINFSNFTVDKGFRGKRFEQWISQRLVEMIVTKRESCKLHYANSQGFSVDIDATYIGDRPEVRNPGPMVTSTMHDGKLIWPGDRVLEKLKAAVRQLPKTGEPCLVVINDQLDSGLFAEELEVILYGTRNIQQRHLGYTKNQKRQGRSRNGFFSPKRNSRVSCVGMYYTNSKMDIIEEELEVYHNPWANSLIDIAMFGSRVVKHYSLGRNSCEIVRL